jgi:hypothetical protein
MKIFLHSVHGDKQKQTLTARVTACNKPMQELLRRHATIQALLWHIPGLFLASIMEGEEMKTAKTAKIILKVYPKTVYRDVEVRVNRTKFDRGDDAFRALDILGDEGKPRLLKSVTDSQLNTLAQIDKYGLVVEIMPNGALQAGIGIER